MRPHRKSKLQVPKLTHPLQKAIIMCHLSHDFACKISRKSIYRNSFRKGFGETGKLFDKKTALPIVLHRWNGAKSLHRSQLRNCQLQSWTGIKIHNTAVYEQKIPDFDGLAQDSLILPFCTNKGRCDCSLSVALVQYMCSTSSNVYGFKRMEGVVFSVAELT